MTASQQSGDHPRPQLIRPIWQSLDGEWEFAHDDDDVGLAQRWQAGGTLPLRIRVPFVPESAASGIGDESFHPVVWYRRTIDLPAAGATDRRILHLGAVDHTADVWVDGNHVVHHVGGQTAFSADITDALVGEAPHTVVVRAYDDPASTENPRGKQDWQAQPHGIWYRRSTGIWRSVWLETVPQQHVSVLDWSTSFPESLVSAQVRLARVPAPGTEVEVVLSHDGTELARGRASAGTSRVRLRLDVPVLHNAQERERYLWSPERPTLIDAEVRVLVGGEATDVVESYVGIRSAGTGNGRFLLNGRPYYVRSVLEQGYWTESHLTAPSVDAYRREVEVIKELGFNAARIHQKVEDPRMLYWADRLGLLIWGETAGAYEYSAQAASLLTAEWLEIVAQYRNHPSIVTWTPANESWGVQDLAVAPDQVAFVRALVELTRALDPSRPVIGNDGWEQPGGDMLTIHDYDSDPTTLAARYADLGAIAEIVDGVGPAGRRLALGEEMTAGWPELPIMLTEFGGIAYSAEGTWGYAVVESDDEFRELVGGLLAAARSSRVLSGFCWTQLTDTLQESNGLLTADREPKLPMPVMRALVTGEKPTD